MNKTAPMLVAGVMSGTSADGINVALVRIGEARDSRSRVIPVDSVGSRRQARPFHLGLGHTIRLLGHAEYSYPAKVRAAVLSAMNADHARVADLSRLNCLLGELYADAVLATQRQFRLKADLVGCHGQTLYHQGDPQAYLGRKVAATWQTGEAAVVAARVGVPVVSDFRPADMAAGGKGAPLVPYLDSLLFGNPKIGRIVQNIGGIANLTAIPAGADANRMFAFDTGPGNMVIDAVMESLFGQAFDRGGKIAASGKVLEPVLEADAPPQVFSGKTSQDRRARGIRAGVCARVLARMWNRPETRHSGHGHGVDGAVNRRRSAAICDVEIRREALFSRNDSLWRRGSKCHARPHPGGRTCAAGNPLAILRRVRPAFRSERSSSVRCARV